jgi:hypothetical protein
MKMKRIWDLASGLSYSLVTLLESKEETKEAEVEKSGLAEECGSLGAVGADVSLSGCGGCFCSPLLPFPLLFLSYVNQPSAETGITAWSNQTFENERFNEPQTRHCSPVV